VLRKNIIHGLSIFLLFVCTPALAEDRGHAGYHSFTQVETYLRQVVSDHPEIATLTAYGESFNRNPLYVLKLSDNAQSNEDEPELMLTAATHGDELITVEVLIGIIDQLLEGYGRDQRLHRLVAERELFFILVVNPDGFKLQQRRANGVDPNREYPWPEEPNRQPNPCIDGIIKFYNSHVFAGSLDLHSAGTSMVMFPWAYEYGAVNATDYAAFAQLASHMAAANGAQSGQISAIMSLSPGSSADYYYWRNGGMALGYEIGTGGVLVPPAAQIPTYIQNHSESVWRFIEAFGSSQD